MILYCTLCYRGGFYEVTCIFFIGNMVVSKENQAFFAKLVEPLATREYLNEMFEEFKRDVTSKFENHIEIQDRKIEELKAELEISKNVSNQLASKLHDNEIKCDDNEQYSRRSCLRIHGVKIKEDGEKEDVMELIKKCYSDMKLDYNPQEIDRAHRIGKVYTDVKTNVKTKSIIVKFKSWGPRTEFYKARPKAFVNGEKKPCKFKVSLDLTKRRHDLLKNVQGTIKNYPDVCFAFADINCSLGLKLNDKIYHYFNDEHQLMGILDNLNYVEIDDE